jgi:hypothetical protein
MNDVAGLDRFLVEHAWREPRAGRTDAGRSPEQVALLTEGGIR